MHASSARAESEVPPTAVMRYTYSSGPKIPPAPTVNKYVTAIEMEKKKTSNNDPHFDLDKQFLEKSGASAQIKDVLTKIIENRPENPIDFLADYFESLGDKVDRVAKAHQQICLTHHTKPAFHNNARIAYDILTLSKTMERKMKGRRDPGSKHARGITGSVYMELLNHLCKEFPPTIRDKVFKKIQCRDFEVVVFDVFKSGVFTSLVLKDFIKLSESLYKSLDAQSCGKVDRLLCEIINKQLFESVTGTSDSPHHILEAGYALGPDRIYSALATAMFQNKQSKGTMSCEEFVQGTADAFLAKVNPLK